MINNTASYSKIMSSQSPIKNYNLVNKKLSLINMKVQPFQESDKKDIIYFRTKLKELNTPGS